MILVYAGIVPSKDATPAGSPLATLRLRAQMLFDQLYRDNATVILPTIAISEVLVPVPDADKGLLIQALAESFLCPTFDTHAADIAAKLWAKHKNLPQDQRYKDRHVLKADAMIIASAKAAGATEFYSNDRDCRKLAEFVMDAHGLPTRPRDLADVFVESDLRSGEGPPPLRPKPTKKTKRKRDSSD
jgi:predicted nucleic acid-binding protein